ncbi:hypothetical protein MJO28_014616 [Puccinia striiformis f. sp. tritici]|uniref:Uncharacterized protein n=1 Tax=Puccinia striiformis f. sp. tritici TaxID=168172 RepID=A0ACC0DU71_9BASI|nr:hypothetical protein MJO28_014616 [Puccinia striiformis f. sp. tritici]
MGATAVSEFLITQQKLSHPNSKDLLRSSRSKNKNSNAEIKGQLNRNQFESTESENQNRCSPSTDGRHLVIADKLHTHKTSVLLID